MQLLTIQHQNVLEQLLSGKTYYADMSHVSPNLIAPYEYMRKFYGWQSCPVFCIPCGGQGTQFGGGAKASVLLGLDVPDDNIHLQYFYDWTDMVYFFEFPLEFEDSFNTDVISTLDDYAKLVLTGVNQGSFRIFQAVIPFIKPEWLVGSSEDVASINNLIHGAEIPTFDKLGFTKISTTTTFFS